MRAFLILSSVLIVAGGSDAQGQPKPAPSKADSGCKTFSDGRVECVKVRTGSADSALHKIFYRTDSAMMNRAALGIELRPTGTRRDTLGVFVAAVTPRGPAETAGIIEGDRIAAINGIDLRGAAADVEDAYTNGVPAHRLSREVQKLTPGARVTLRVYSAGRFRDVVVTAGRASEVLRHAGGFNFRRLGPGSGMEFRGPDGMMEFGGPLRRMEFRRPDGSTIYTPGMPLRIERFGPGAPARIRALPRKSQQRRPAPELLRQGTVPAPLEDEILELKSESLPDFELIPSGESELEVEPIET